MSMLASPDNAIATCAHVMCVSHVSEAEILPAHIHYPHYTPTGVGVLLLSSGKPDDRPTLLFIMNVNECHAKQEC